jgi:hypothetical protein
MTISILVEPSQVGFRAMTGGPLELSAEAASAAEAVDAIQEMIAGRLERGAILIDHHVNPPRSPIPGLSLAENERGRDCADVIAHRVARVNSLLPARPWHRLPGCTA